jgi:small subunit ribosomal protein S16
MVKIRLRRVGSKKQPSYRIVVADSRAPRDGRFIEVIGFYNPRTEPETVTIQEDRALHWLGVGAQPTRAVARFLEQCGTQDRFRRLQAGESLEDLLAEIEEADDEAGEAPADTGAKMTVAQTEAPSGDQQAETSEAEETS